MSRRDECVRIPLGATDPEEVLQAHLRKEARPLPDAERIARKIATRIWKTYDAPGERAEIARILREEGVAE